MPRSGLITMPRRGLTNMPQSGLTNTPRRGLKIMPVRSRHSRESGNLLLQTATHHPQQLPPFASLLALFVEGATSLPGFWSKNPTGISLNPAVMQGCTGKSSGRGW